VEKAKATLPTDKTIAVYCRSGRRSASAAGRLADVGYKCVNLKGGIIAWKEAGMSVAKDAYEVDVFKTKNGKTVKFHAMMHSCVRIEYDGKEIQIDPVSKLRDKVIDYAAMPKADYIFVTHEHGDHYDAAALKLLTGDKTQLVMNQRCAEMYGSGIVMANGQSKTFDDIKVEAVPAYNTTEGHLQFHPKGRDNGYILTLDGLRIYIAGDTEDIPEMEQLKDIDIAFLPCNQPYTMTVDQLVRAAKIIKPKVLFPYHYSDTSINQVLMKLVGSGIDVRIRDYK
jgi:L-ascorbate metabolism protein UlaG (beta-lactamase superfamily)